MAKDNLARQRSKQRKLDRKRRREKKETRYSTPVAQQLSPKLDASLGEAYALIESRKFADAEELLTSLTKRYPPGPALVEAQMFLYQVTNNHRRGCEAAKQLARLTPRDPDARLIYAQESMLCGRFGIALANYRLFVERWPNHLNADIAREAIDMLEPECAAAIHRMGFDGASLDTLVMHDESLELMQRGKFDEAVERCLKLLQLAPDFMTARNNLAVSYFHSGKLASALQVVEETCRLAPDNRFAEATLGKFRFLSGQEDEANAIADRIVVNPPSDSDPLTAALELLSFLGRDEDVVVLFQAATDFDSFDPACQAMLLHCLAVAQCRLHDEKAARATWRRCLKVMPTFVEARENLDDLDSGRGHAPWALSVAPWLPRNVTEQIMSDQKFHHQTGQANFARAYPTITAIIPALLERGDPMGRELAMRTAFADGSPEMLQALERFALGSRGPDKMRHDILAKLCRNDHVTTGPHRFYSNGKWIEIKLFSTEINWEAKPSSAWARKLSDAGMEAMKQRDFTLAEKTFNQILDKEPDNCTAAYNLAVIWLQRDGELGQRRAKACLERLHEQFPDYLFASIGLAQLAAMDGDFERAGELIAPILDNRKLHGSEALALFALQIQIAIELRNFDAAEQAYSMLVAVADDDDPLAAQLRRRIDKAARKPLLARLLPWG